MNEKEDFSLVKNKRIISLKKERISLNINSNTAQTSAEREGGKVSPGAREREKGTGLEKEEKKRG